MESSDSDEKGNDSKGPFSKMNRRVKGIIQNIEDSEIPIVYFFLTFFFAVAIRNFFEASLYTHLYGMPAVFNLHTLLHFYSSYLGLAFGITILFYIALKKPILKILRVVLPTFILLIIAPITDYTIRLITGKPGIRIGYIIESEFSEAFSRYLTYFGNFEPETFGVTTGMKIEILLIILLGFLYLLVSSSSKIKSIIFSFLLYSVIFWEMIAFPSLLRTVFDVIGLGTPANSTTTLTHMFLILIVIQGTVIFYLHKKEYFISIIKDIRPFRLMHFEFMFILGIGLAVKITGKPFSFSSQILKIIILMISIAFAWLYSIFINNLEDIEIDRVTNEDRPLIEGDIERKKYTKMAWLWLFLSLILAYSVDVVFMFLILTYIAGYFVYSAPPFRFKKLPIISKAFISLNSLVLVISGYWLINYSLISFPAAVTVMLLVGFTLVINFIDLKDYEGDKKAGILTLPVLLGMKKAKFLIGLFFIFTYLSGYFIIQNFYMLTPLALLGVLQFYLINKEDYEEKPVFMIYISSLFFLLIVYMGI